MERRIENLNESQLKLLRQLKSSFLTRLFFLRSIPTLFFWKAKVKYLDTEKCQVSVPYNWKNRNPFNSIYFATLAGAAELSTGGLALLATRGHNISLIVTGVEGKFIKKGTKLSTFTCDDGAKVFDIVDIAMRTGEAQSIQLQSDGYMESGDKIASFSITWSFKKRKTAN